MYRIDTFPDFFTGVKTKLIYKNGRFIADIRGGVIRIEHYSTETYISRSQGYKYWQKYFPDRPYYTLPKELQMAIEEQPKTCGYYIDRKGELIGYEG